MSYIRSVIPLLCLLLLAPLSAPAESVDTSPLPVGFDSVRGAQKISRPVIVTHAGDGSHRLFVASQLGKLYALPAEGGQPTLILDLTTQVAFAEKQNEEGFLGLAFHPNFSRNRQLFVYYTTRDVPHASVISRFTMDADNPNRVDPASELEVLRVPQPFSNHNGGTILFGPDGYLYIALGDGGAGNDPQMNGQNVQTLLGSILRIDVDRRDKGLQYAIPIDNPFVGYGRRARGEIWAYGLRNVWRMAFDRQTGALWAADVGQDLWEEINLIVRGGNYGWNLREGRHRFEPVGSGPRDDLIEPIWEFHHDVGKSITGGFVYRGRAVPALQGAYLYADYVTGKLWALRYDPDAGRVVANHSIAGNTAPVVTFGEDEAGEAYFATLPTGVYRFRAAN